MIRDVELYVLSKAFSKVMGDEVEHYYERCLVYHHPMDTNTNKYVILEKIEIGKLDL
jgi:hypothetical protein